MEKKFWVVQESPGYTAPNDWLIGKIYRFKWHTKNIWAVGFKDQKDDLSRDEVNELHITLETITPQATNQNGLISEMLCHVTNNPGFNSGDYSKGYAEDREDSQNYGYKIYLNTPGKGESYFEGRTDGNFVKDNVTNPLSLSLGSHSNKKFTPNSVIKDFAEVVVNNFKYKDQKFTSYRK